MANRRMFSRDVASSDAFLDMPLSAQALYFHLGLAADDEGFLNSPLSVLRMVGGCRDDLNLLIAKKFVIPFESGVCVIRHWRTNNYCRSDRFKPTLHTAERAMLTIGSDLVYQMDTTGIPDDNLRYTDGIPSIVEYSKEEIFLSEPQADSDVESKKDVPKGRKRPIYEPDSKFMKAAQWLADDIAKQQPGCKQPTSAQLQAWSNDFRLMEERDGIAWELIRETLLFARGDSFWCGNILSGGKFRKQYNTLRARMESPAKAPAQAQQPARRELKQL